MPALKSISIGSYNMKNVRNFTIDGLESLQTLSVGVNSFLLNNVQRNDGEVRISNCPLLQSIIFESSSFEDYNVFRVNNVPSLDTIDMKGDNFRYTYSFDIDSNS